MDLAEFLLARIAEDEAWLQAAAKHWACYPPPQEPTRLLAECEAKREIIRAYQLRAEQGSQRGGEVFGYHATGLGIAIRQLGVVYADHPDYRDEWRP